MDRARVSCLLAVVCLAGAVLAQPPNDECAGALVAGNGNTPGTNVGATNSAGVPPGACATFGRDVWYLYTATCSGVVTVSFCATEGGSASFDTVLQVFTGTCASLTRIACNDDTCALQSRVSFAATSGTTYIINVAGFGTSTGTFTMNIACVPGLANDECAGAIVIGNGNTPGTNVGATNSAGVPPGSCASGGLFGADVWYLYTATCTGNATISFCAAEGGSATFDNVVDVFTGTCASLTRVACNDDSCALQSRVTFPVTSGTPYYILVAGWNGATGTFVMNIGCVQTVPIAADGDFIACENDTNAGSTTHRVYSINRTSGLVSTLFAVPPSTTILPNWVQMARDNSRVAVAYSLTSTYGLTYLDTLGNVAASHATTWRTDNLRVADNARLLWNGLTGTGPALTLAVMATDDTAASPTILVPGLPSTATPLNGDEIEDNGLFAVSAQGSVPNGYVAITDLSAGTIVTTYTGGMGLLNTIDYNGHDGNLYGTEFGLPGNSGAFGGTLWRVSPSGTITSVAGGLAYDRMNAIEVAQDGTLVVGSRHNVLVLDTAGTILRTLPFQVDRTRAATGATIYGNNRLQLDTSGGTGPGSAIGVRVSVRHSEAPGAVYVLAPSLYMRPASLLGNGEILDLFPDSLTLVAMTGLLGSVFQNFTGVLDMGGNASASLNVPAGMQPGTNLRLFIAGVVLRANGSVIAVTETEGVTLR